MRRSLLIVAALALPAHADVPMEPQTERWVQVCHRLENPEVGRFVVVSAVQWDGGGRTVWRAVEPDGCLLESSGGRTLVAAVDTVRWRELAGREEKYELAADGVALVDLPGQFSVSMDNEHRKRDILYRVASADDKRIVLYKARVTDVFEGDRQSVKEFPKP